MYIIMPKRNSEKEFIFPDFPEFTPNLSPREIFQLGSFGGTYWRPIYSSTNDKQYQNIHLHYPKSWWKDIPNENLISSWDKYNKNINYYNVKVGQTLEQWENSGWMTQEHPYGWMHWYCDFFSGKRSPDDQHQIERWKKLAGPKGRFRRALINLIKKKQSKFNDFSVSPGRRQTLQHWAYQLSEKDFNN